MNIDLVFVVYGFYAGVHTDEMEHNSIAVFSDYSAAVDYGVGLIKKFKVDDYLVVAQEVRCPVAELAQ